MLLDFKTYYKSVVAGVVVVKYRRYSVKGKENPGIDSDMCGHLFSDQCNSIGRGKYFERMGPKQLDTEQIITHTWDHRH